MEAVEHPKVLIVDDKPANLTALRALLGDMDITILEADSGNAALSLSLEHDLALVLMDVQMPEMDGFETAELLRVNQVTRHVPIIFVTAISKEQHHIFKGYESGAVDYIFKPLEPHIIKNKVRVFVDLFRQNQIIKAKNRELEQANQTILKQQEALVQEERLKVLLQMAGAAAHELNQPLMILLGNLEMLDLVKDDHEKIMALVPKIRKAGETISNTVKKIQKVRYDVSVSHDSKTEIINLDPDIRILAVEDSDLSYEVYETCLKDDCQMSMSRATTIKEAVAMLEAEAFNIILLDYELPDGTGLDLLEKMNAGDIDLPVVAITGIEDGQIASNFLKAGAFDYLSKSQTDKKTLIKAICDSLEKFKFKKETSLLMEKMSKDAITDQLTGLYNRRYMEGVLNNEVERAKRYNSPLCCLVFDLDHFKIVNDTHGHLCGDFILKEFSNILLSHKRQPDHIFRYGGEEFICLTPQTDLQGAREFAQRVRKTCQEREFIYSGTAVNITVSAGIAQLQCESERPIHLIERADRALYRAKTRGRNCVEID